MRLRSLVIKIAKYYIPVHILAFTIYPFNPGLSQNFYILGLLSLPILTFRGYSMGKVFLVLIGVIAVLALVNILRIWGLLIVVIIGVIFRDELRLLLGG